MKRFLVSLFCIMALVITMAVPAFANDGTTNMYTRWYADMYKEADYGKGVVQQVPANECVICYAERKNGFVHCFYGTKDGWMALSDLDTVINNNNGGSRNNNLNGTYNTAMYTITDVNLRQQPDVDSRKLTTVRFGDPVYVYSIDSGWARVDYGNTPGYIDADYLNFAQKVTPAAPVTPVTPVASDVAWAKNYDWSAVYNFADYIALNPDVAKAFGNNQNAAFEHFIRNGMNECRQASRNWNILNYALSHPDLVTKYGTNYRAYYESACGIPVQ